MMKKTLINTDSTGRITTVLEVFDPPSGAYEGMYDATQTLPIGATHFRDGEFLTQPPAPSRDHVWDEPSFAWVVNLDLAWANIRQKRQQLLTASDWTQYADVVLANKEEWATYRQALRDVTSQPDPLNIVWPISP